MESRRKNPDVLYENLSPNCTRPRNKFIRRITPHCVAGNLTIETTLNLSSFQNYSEENGASCTYAIGSDGRIGLGVEEFDRPWTSSSRINDHQAVTFEIANIGGPPDWRMSDAAINTFLDAAVENALYYGYSKIHYEPKPDYISGYAAVEAWIATWAEDDEMIVTLHNWFANKACPGAYFMRQLPWLVREINKRLSGMVPEKFVGEGSAPSVTVPSKPEAAQEPAIEPPSTGTSVSYLIRIAVTALNIRKGPGTDTAVVKTLVKDKNVYTIVEEAEGPGAPKWGKLKSGIGWIALNYTQRV